MLLGKVGFLNLLEHSCLLGWSLAVSIFWLAIVIHHQT